MAEIEKKKEPGVQYIDVKNLVDAIGYMLSKEYNRCSMLYNQVKDIKVRVIVKKELDFMETLFKSLGIENCIKKAGGDGNGKPGLVKDDG